MTLKIMVNEDQLMVHELKHLGIRINQTQHYINHLFQLHFPSILMSILMFIYDVEISGLKTNILMLDLFQSLNKYYTTISGMFK